MVGGSMGGAAGMIYSNNHLDPTEPMVAATASGSGILDCERRAIEMDGNNSMTEWFGGNWDEVPFQYHRNSAIYFNDFTQSMHFNLKYLPIYLDFGVSEPHRVHAEEMHETVNLAKKSGLSVILSFHDFTTTPDGRQLLNVVQEGNAKGSDLIKIATTTDNPAQLCNLLSLFRMPTDKPLALMGMGKLGMASRLIAAQSGSVLNYAAMDEATAPGQWPVEEFRDLIQRAGIQD